MRKILFYCCFLLLAFCLWGGSVLAENKINIEDINQTIVQGNFTMFMLVDFSNAKISLKELHNLMVKVGEEIGVSIHVQHQDIFDVMHNV